MVRVVVATSNPGKIAEIRAALAVAGIEAVGLDGLGFDRPGFDGRSFDGLRFDGLSSERPGLDKPNLDALRDGGEVEETGATFEENARIKAEAYSTRTALPVLADDSGIEVDALGGAPGVQSARYGGPDLDDPGRNRLLLANLHGVPEEKRMARFRCVLAVARRGRTLATFEGVVEGRITDAPRGAGGFGYDPLFFHDGIGTTFGMISREDKQRLSHRGQAIERFIEAVKSGRLAL